MTKISSGLTLFREMSVCCDDIIKGLVKCTLSACPMKFNVVGHGARRYRVSRTIIKRNRQNLGGTVLYSAPLCTFGA